MASAVRPSSARMLPRKRRASAIAGIGLHDPGGDASGLLTVPLGQEVPGGIERRALREQDCAGEEGQDIGLMGSARISAVLRDSGALGHVDQLIRRHPGQFLDLSQRPANLDIGGVGGAEAEVQPAVVDREIGGLAQHFLRLHRIAVAHRDPRADGAAVGFDARQLDLEPVVAAGHVVAQERRRLILIDDQDVDVAIVIEIAEGTAAAGVRGFDARVRLRAINSSNWPLPRLRKRTRGVL